MLIRPTHWFVLVAASVTAGSVTPAPPASGSKADATPALTDLAFMTGGWRAEWQGNLLEEQFSSPSHGTMIGMFRWMADGSTRLTEHMVLEQHDDGVHLLLRHFHPGNMPWEQESEGPLDFRLTAASDGRAVFEDPDNPFPTRIIYHRAEPDTLVVRLEGRGDGD